MKTRKMTLALVVMLPAFGGVAQAAEAESEYPPLEPDEVAVPALQAPTAAPAATAAAVAKPQVQRAPAQARSAVAAQPRQGYTRQGYYGYPGYPAQQGYYQYRGQRPYYGYRRPPRYSSGPMGFGMPGMRGPWTTGPWNNGSFNRRNNWFGGGPSSWFGNGRGPKEGMSRAWDDMINAPSEMGTMPGGWEFPSVSVPNPVDSADELGKGSQDFVREAPNMIDIK